MTSRIYPLKGDVQRGDHLAGAIFSADEVYRYLLWRIDPGANVVRTCLFVLLNPSTADETKLDPTLTRCWGFTRAWGYTCMLVANVFAFRSTDPKGLPNGLAVAAGIRNIPYLVMAMKVSQKAIAGWGASACVGNVGIAMAGMAKMNNVRLECLGLTKAGQPRHPLYLRADSKPMPWVPRCPSCANEGSGTGSAGQASREKGGFGRCSCDGIGCRSMIHSYEEFLATYGAPRPRGN